MKTMIIDYQPFNAFSFVTVFDGNCKVKEGRIEALPEEICKYAYQHEAYDIKINASAHLIEGLAQDTKQYESKYYDSNKLIIEGI